MRGSIISALVCACILASSVVLDGGLLANPSSSAPPAPQALQPASAEARYVFSLDLDGDGEDELLRVIDDQLVAHKISQGALSAPLWSVKGPGQAHLISSDRSTGALRVFVAWGVGPGMLKRPLSLTELNPKTGAQRLLWRHEGPRAQAVHLKAVPTNQGLTLRVAHFISKYQTRALSLSGLALTGAWGAQRLEQLQSGPALPLTAKTSRELRMGTSWAYADVDGDGVEEEIVGRVYGDKKGEYGELSLYREGGAEAQVIPTERGVKAVYWAQWGGDEGRGAVYWSDGWVAEYGKKARARLKRLRWREGRATVELIASSKADFTFFELWTHPRPGAGATRAPLLFARGNKTLNLITPQAEGPWRVTSVASLPPVVNATVLYAEGAWWVALPIPRQALQLKRITHPLLNTEGGGDLSP